MGAKESAHAFQPFDVARSAPLNSFLYLAPGAKKLRRNDEATLPRPTADAGARIVRVVCISDTHNEHRGLRLPPGDLLVHAGDCLTEGGQRHYVTGWQKNRGGHVTGVTPEGEELFRKFSEWFGAQNYRHKVLIGGNHDLVVHGLGKQRVQQMLDEDTKIGKCTYLEHEMACLGGVRIFGSPFERYGGLNDGFYSDGVDYADVPEGVHILMTHYPCLLPGKQGATKLASREMCATIDRTGALLHVSGHCHWAHGLYHSPGGTPCVVASVCGSTMPGPWDADWSEKKAERLQSVNGVRGDPMDRDFGGYNLNQLPIVCDLQLTNEEGDDDSAPSELASTPHKSALSGFDDEGIDKPALLFFGPPNDPEFVRRALPQVRERFVVEFVDSTADGLQAVSSRKYAGCVAKLGTENNLAYPILQALRKSQGEAPFIVIHSSTAARSERTRSKLTRELNINLFVAQENEEEMYSALSRLAASGS